MNQELIVSLNSKVLSRSFRPCGVGHKRIDGGVVDISFGNIASRFGSLAFDPGLFKLLIDHSLFFFDHILGLLLMNSQESGL